MSKGLYLAAMEPHSGKSLVVLAGLMAFYFETYPQISGIVLTGEQAPAALWRIDDNSTASNSDHPHQTVPARPN